MLILSRKKGQNLFIGDNVIISILNVKGSQVRIGIQAPKHIDVHREEVYRRVLAERTNQKTEVDFVLPDKGES